MKNKLFTGLCVLLVAMSMVLTGCGKEPQKQVDSRPLQVALTQDMRSFDPILTSDIYSEAVLRSVYTSLFDLDEQLALRHKLAKTTTVVDDTSWKIEIHDNVKWQDGSPLTVDDVVFSINRAMNGERTKKLLEVVDRVEKIDDTSFMIYAKQPYTDLMTVFAKAETSIVSKKVVEAPGYDFAKPVGAGPFKVISREEGSKISLERFDDYFLDKAASKYLDFVVIVKEQERTAAFLSGNIDVLFSVSAYDSNKLKLSDGVQLLQKPSTKIEYLSLNNNHKPLDNPKVRIAISHAINRDNIANSVYNGYSLSASSLIPRGIIGSSEEIVPYDPEQAKALLKEAGHENGFEITVIAIDTIRKNTLEYIKLDLAQVGITLNYNLVTMSEAVELMTAGEHGGILVGWAFNSDPNSVLPLLLGTGSGKTMNSSNYTNPKVDALIAQGQGEADREKKRQIYEEINNIVTEEAPIVVLQNPMILAAARDNIDGIHLNPQGLIQYESMYRK